MDLDNIWRFDLIAGSSKSPDHGACLMDAISWLEYGHLGDQPECVCPILASYGRSINDLSDIENRQALKHFIPRLAGSRDDRNAVRRSYYIVEESIRQFAFRFDSDGTLERVMRELMLRAATQTTRTLYDGQDGSYMFISSEEMYFLRKLDQKGRAPFLETARKILDRALQIGKEGSADIVKLRDANETFAKAASEIIVQTSVPV